jgi:hypothetical protein
MFQRFIDWLFGKETTITIPFQINGKVVGRLQVTDSDLNNLNGNMVKVVVIPNRIVNVVKDRC